MRKLCVLLLAVTLIADASAFAQTASPALKIVVVKGEDAVNIIQQKTAVAPVVEVRDRNNLPVPGATVTFALNGSGASFAGGAQSITVVTNAAGQATAAGLTPTATGALNISATATFQGQTAIATIAQTTVQTAAEAAGAAGGGAAGGGSGGAASGGAAGGGAGGGLSGTTLGIIGGVGAAGALGVAKAAGGGDSGSSTSSTTSTPTASAPSSTTASTPTTTTTTPTTTTPPVTSTPAPTPAPSAASTFSGPMDGSFQGSSTSTFSGPGGFTLSCTYTERQTGTATLRVQTTGGVGTGTMEMSGRQIVSNNSCGELPPGILADQPFTWTANNVEVSGSSVRFTQEFRDSGSVPGATYSSVSTMTFTGTISGTTLTGSLNMSATVDVRGDGFQVKGTWSGQIPVTMTVR